MLFFLRETEFGHFKLILQYPIRDPNAEQFSVSNQPHFRRNSLFLHKFLKIRNKFFQNGELDVCDGSSQQEVALFTFSYCLKVQLPSEGTQV